MEKHHISSFVFAVILLRIQNYSDGNNAFCYCVVMYVLNMVLNINKLVQHICTLNNSYCTVNM